jgi:Xaa-Pro aminopeptidase
MKKDLAPLMEAEGLDAVLILGSSRHNPDMYYFTGGVHITSGALVLKRGSPGVLFCHSMERDEAAQTGLRVEIFEPFTQLLELTGGDRKQAQSLRMRRVLERAGVVAGRVAVGGRADLGTVVEVFPDLQRHLPDLVISGLKTDSVIRQAMATKDKDEIERIRRMGRVTVEVVGRIADFLTSHRAKDGVLVKGDGEPLTIREVKRRINLELAERGAENTHGTIFAAGRDGAVPHSAGTDDSPVPLGKAIVFDLFPCEEGGGYYYDFTRTWCLGHAPDGVQDLYQDVLEVYGQVVDQLEPGGLCSSYQDLTCDLFEAREHVTVRVDPETEDGYTHAIGHGLGLNVHELPNFGEMATERDVLSPGVVFTIEPGLYYPDLQTGIRLEDTYYVGKDGRIEKLADYPLDLVLPVAG